MKNLDNLSVGAEAIVNGVKDGYKRMSDLEGRLKDGRREVVHLAPLARVFPRSHHHQQSERGINDVLGMPNASNDQYLLYPISSSQA